MKLNGGFSLELTTHSPKIDRIMGEVTLEQLNEQVQALTHLCQKQSKIIASTGQQLLELQKQRLKEIDTTPDLSKIDFDDFVTNDDLVGLVAELQGQLEQLDERLIRRTFNSSSKTIIAPLINQDGELPEKLLFPATISELESIEKFALVLLAEFYDLTLIDETIPFDKRVEAVTDEKEIDLFNLLAQYLGLGVRRGSPEW
ncbi:uncharacterized protein KQ657_003729 [Scheffersomyces spartinae]|uniref:Uncharacterized protein n=1 Tax=Scheffersomyces spartinae TaxID=45513 RepID=A0A9P7VBX4_9ASCO|nr:uncharacterized protein KQ657_003729 [Scheffersomyces spartinae]KAG7195203.1 hypothetical protein KQ657_003729 [Scheffersomyces spartinae]